MLPHGFSPLHAPPSIPLASWRVMHRKRASLLSIHSARKTPNPPPFPTNENQGHNYETDAAACLTRRTSGAPKGYGSRASSSLGRARTAFSAPKNNRSPQSSISATVKPGFRRFQKSRRPCLASCSPVDHVVKVDSTWARARKGSVKNSYTLECQGLEQSSDLVIPYFRMATCFVVVVLNQGIT